MASSHHAASTKRSGHSHNYSTTTPAWAKPPPHLSCCTEMADTILKSEDPARYAPLLEAKYYPYSRSQPAPLQRSAYDRSGEGEGSRPVRPPCFCRVEDKDCVEAALELVASNQCKRVAILNMANAYNCGGGWERLMGAQEEYLFRRTSLALSLWPHRRMNDHRWPLGSNALPAPTKATTFYPFSECGGVFTPNIRVMTDVKERPYASSDFSDEVRAEMELLSQSLCVISIAAQDLRPDRKHNEGNLDFDRNLTMQKFRTALFMAADNNCDGVVLGAIGCGAFQNPPLEVASVFSHLLAPVERENRTTTTDDGTCPTTTDPHAGEFSRAFQYATFAIIKSHRNIGAFQEVFGEVLV